MPNLKITIEHRATIWWRIAKVLHGYRVLHRFAFLFRGKKMYNVYINGVKRKNRGISTADIIEE